VAAVREGGAGVVVMPQDGSLTWCDINWLPCHFVYATYFGAACQRQTIGLRN